MRPRERSKITTIPMMNQPSGIGQKEDSESSKLSSSMSDKRFSKSCVSNLFTSIPPIAALKKKAVVWKRSSAIGALWDVSQVFFSILACGLYIAETYQSSYGGDLILRWIEIVITQFFSLDFLFNWFVATTTKLYFLSPMTYVDIITIVPVYLTLILGDRNIPNLSLLRFVRILRLIRILRTFKMLGGLSGIRRQVITLSLTLLSLTFMAAGIVQVMENDVKQLSYDCRFINEDTRYQPSCTSSYPSYDDDNCDCNKNNCFPAYADGDSQGEPSLIRCLVLPYFDCFYFIVVTMATVGYGDISPSTAPSKAVIIMFIVTSLIVIPMQINKLNLLISMSSTFRNTYAPQSHETHVIVCGHVNDSSKLERLFKEFFHPDRYVHSAPEYHLVILSPLEPTEEVRSLLVSPLFDSRVTYIIGSALSMDDLQRVRADIAAAMFFVCNIEVQSQEAFFDDASTVLRTLSVSNFNSNLECFVQVLRPEDRDILKDSDVDVIICLDEFKTSIQARNAICPGLSTLIENLFHSFGQQIEPTKENDSYWLDEYIYGARMELYYVPLPELLLEALNYDWNLLVEGIYNQFGRMLIGVCNTDSHSVIFNPGLTEFQKFHSAEKFFKVFQIGIVICSDQSEASEIAVGIADHSSIEKITLKLTEMEASFAVRRLPEDDGGGGSGSDSYGGNGSHSLGSLSLTSQRRKYEKSYRDIITYSKLVPKQLLSHETDEGKQLLQQQQQEGGGLGKGGRKTGHGNSSGSTLPGNNSRARRGAAAPQKTTSRTESLTLPTLKVDIPEGFGKPSMKLSDASNIMDHVIVFGCVDYIHIFVNELRRPLISGDAYRPIVIVSEFEPHRWNTIKSKYTDVYYVQEVLTTSQGFNASNVRDANAVILLASRDSVTMVEEENLDAETLFAYLKLERYIPRFVYFTVELTCANNMSVLNSTIMRSKRQVKVTTQNLHTRQFNDMTNENTEGKAGGGGGGGGGMFQKPGARMEHTQLRGSFTSQRKVITVGEMNQTKSSKNLLRTNPGRRLSSMKIRSLEKSDLGQEKKKFNVTKNFWDLIGTHHVLPVFAAGRSYVPSVFDSLLSQSFFSSLTPVICEKLVCGQSTQTMFQENIPSPFYGRLFVDLFRSFQSRGILALGLYRHPIPATDAVLPYVFTSPWADTIIRENDKVYLFGHPTVIRDALSEFSAGFLTSPKGELGLRSNIPLSGFSELRQSMRQGFVGHVASIISEGDEAASIRYTSNIQHYQEIGEMTDRANGDGPAAGGGLGGARGGGALGQGGEQDEEEDDVIRSHESKMEGSRTHLQ